jgi:hypothetical protein
MLLLFLLLLGLAALRESNGQPPPENCGDAEASSGYKTVAAINEAAIASAGPFAICPNTVLDDDVLRPLIDGTVILCATTTTSSASCILSKGILMDADDIRVSLVGIIFADFDEPMISGSAGPTSTLELRQVIFRVRHPTACRKMLISHRQVASLLCFGNRISTHRWQWYKPIP